jgi:hypothetical protein
MYLDFMISSFAASSGSYSTIAFYNPLGIESQFRGIEEGSKVATGRELRCHTRQAERPVHIT